MSFPGEVISRLSPDELVHSYGILDISRLSPATEQTLLERPDGARITEVNVDTTPTTSIRAVILDGQPIILVEYDASGLRSVMVGMTFKPDDNLGRNVYASFRYGVEN